MIGRLEDLFLAEGFTHLTIDDLCRHLHCSKTTLYSIAESREQIIQAVTRHFFATATTIIEDAVEQESDPGQRIVKYLGGIGTAMSRNSSDFYHDMVGYQPTAEIYRVNSVAAARRTKELIDAGVVAGVFRTSDAAFAAQAVALLIDGVQSGVLLESTGLTAGEAFSELAELLMHGLAVS